MKITSDITLLYLKITNKCWIWFQSEYKSNDFVCYLFVTGSNWNEYWDMITNESINYEIDVKHDNWCTFVRLDKLTVKSE